MGDDTCFAGACTGEDEEGAFDVGDGKLLLGIEFGHIFTCNILRDREKNSKRGECLD